MEVLPQIKAWPLVAAVPPSPYCFGELLLDTFPTKGLPLPLLAEAASPKRLLLELIYWRLIFLLSTAVLPKRDVTTGVYLSKEKRLPPTMLLLR